MKRIRKMLPVVFASIATVSCGGGGGGGGGGLSASTTNIYSGVAIDGNLSNARAFLDLNGNGTFETGEPVAITGLDGSYSIAATADQIASHSVVVEAIVGQTIDQDDPLTTINQSFTLIAPPGHPEVVSPLTTHVVAKISSGLSISAAQAAVKQELGLANIDLMTNYIVKKTTDSSYVNAHKVAVAIVEVLKSVDSESSANTSLSNRLSATVSKVSTQVAPSVQNIKQASTTAAARNLIVNIIETSTNIYNVGGRITGLLGNGLVLSSGTGTSSPLAGSRTFTLPNLQASGSSYDLKIQTQPTGQICSVSNGSGNLSNQSITSIEVYCAENKSVGGVVSGLTTNGLILKNGNEELGIQAGASSFKFATELLLGERYSISVLTQPTGRNCSVANGFGDMPQTGVNNVHVTCSPNSYYVGGTISGLFNNGLRLESGGEILEVSSGASYFSFNNRTALGGAYSVRVHSQPSGLTCSVANGSGTIAAADVTSVSISCSAVSYSLSGSVIGLSASGLRLKAGQEVLVVTANNSNFAFAQKVAFNSNYSVMVDRQPDGLVCTISNSTGIMPASDVTNVQVACILAPPTLLVSPESTFTLNITKINSKVKVDYDSYGYWMVLPVTTSSPTAANIKSLLSVNPHFSNNQVGTFNGVSFVGGTDLLRAGETVDITLSDLNFSTNYKFYFVAALQSSLESTTNVISFNFTTPAPIFTEVDFVTVASSNELRQCGYDFGASLIVNGSSCLNVDRTQRVELISSGQYEQSTIEAVTKDVSTGQALKRKVIATGDTGLAIACSDTSLVYVSTSQGFYTYNRRTDEVLSIANASFPIGLDGLSIGGWDSQTVYIYKKDAPRAEASWCAGFQPFFWGASLWSPGIWKMKPFNP